MKENQGYPFEKARDEAEKVREIAQTWKKNLKAEKNQQKEFADKYSIPLEQIIPGINTAGLDIDTNRPSGRLYENPYVESDAISYEKGHGMDAGTSYIETLLGLLSNQRLRDFLEPFKNTAVLDLGARECKAYFLARSVGARAYIGVDKFRAPGIDINFLKKQGEFFDHLCNHLNNDNDIPYALAKDDMLEFLKRMPDNSASILTSAVPSSIGFGGDYVEAVNKEIVRVLDPQGAHINFFSHFEPKELIREELDKNILDLYGGVQKFTKE